MGKHENLDGYDGNGPGPIPPVALLRRGIGPPMWVHEVCGFMDQFLDKPFGPLLHCPDQPSLP